MSYHCQYQFYVQLYQYFLSFNTANENFFIVHGCREWLFMHDLSFNLYHWSLTEGVQLQRGSYATTKLNRYSSPQLNRWSRSKGLARARNLSSFCNMASIGPTSVQFSKMASGSPKWLPCVRFSIMLNYFPKWPSSMHGQWSDAMEKLKFHPSSTEDFASPKMDRRLFPVVGHQKWSNTP